jgi:hypothetical protein
MNLFEKYREEFRQTVAKMNVAADHNNRTDNFYECGRLAVLKSIIEDMGHTVDGKMISDKDNGMQRAIFIMLDGESLGNFTSDTKGLFEIFTPDEPVEDQDETEEKD